jgi:hypothetical protein
LRGFRRKVMKKIVLACRYEDLDYFNRGVFCRKDITLRTEPDVGSAVALALKNPPDLFLIRENPADPPGKHLEELSRHWAVVPFQVAVMSDSKEHAGLPSFVATVIPSDTDPKAFNTIIAGLLDLPLRRNRRLDITAALDLSASGMETIARTVNISATGMLVETSVPLTPGETCKVRLMNIKGDKELPEVSARVLREEIEHSILMINKRYAMEFTDIPPETVEEMIRQVSGMPE